MKKHLRPIITFSILIAAAVFPAEFNAGESRGDYLAQAASSRARGYSSSNKYLTESHRDLKNGFEINPPAGWYKDVRGRRHLVRFSSTSYDVFIMIDLVPVSSRISLDREFTKFINEKNREVKKALPGFGVQSNRKVKLRGQYAYRTEAVFKAGPNPVLMSIYYVPSKTGVFMITTICPEALALRWGPVLSSSVKTFATIE